MPSRGLFVLFYSVWTPDAKNHKARACDRLLIVNNKGLKYSHNCTVIIIKGSTRGSFDFFGSVWTPDVKNHKKRSGRSHWNNYLVLVNGKVLLFLKVSTIWIFIIFILDMSPVTKKHQMNQKTADNHR